jgi:hypothetical protein
MAGMEEDDHYIAPGSLCVENVSGLINHRS